MISKQKTLKEYSSAKKKESSLLQLSVLEIFLERKFLMLSRNATKQVLLSEW